MSETQKSRRGREDRAPWVLLPCALLTLGGVSLLAPRQAAQAAPPPAQAAAAPAVSDDGDGDELLEHWGDPKYAREGRTQMAGMAAGFLLLGGLAYRKRIRVARPPVSLRLEDVGEQRKAA